MKFLLTLVALGSLLFILPPAIAEPPALPNLDQFKKLDTVIEDAIAQGRCPGAVVYVGLHDKPLYRKAYGFKSVKPEKVAMTADTIFDMASLTKPIATSTSIMILADRGKLKVSDKVSKYIPAFANHGKEEITIEQLLLHRGGLIPDNPIEDFDKGSAAGLEAIYNSSPKWPVGSQFTYSDVGFIVLGKVVEAASGRSLDRFAQEEIFTPLGMKDTGYNPPLTQLDRFAPTEMRAGKWIVGQVHDPRSFAMSGVAGHAGLFSTVDDLAIYCRMVIHHGALDGHRIMSEATAREWITTRTFPDGSDGRTYGYDVDTPYSSPRGDRFEKGKTLGHSGFTGTSLWIDPVNDCFVILLTNSVHPNGKGNVIGLRRKVATIAAEAILGPAPARAK